MYGSLPSLYPLPILGQSTLVYDCLLQDTLEDRSRKFSGHELDWVDAKSGLILAMSSMKVGKSVLISVHSNCDATEA